MQELAEDPESNPDYNVENGLLFYKGCIVVPDDPDIKKEILKYCHDDITAGHYGIFKTHDLVSRTLYLPGLRTYVKKYVTSCDICQRNKTSRHKPFGLFQSLPTPEHPWSSISMDFITQLPESDG